MTIGIGLLGCGRVAQHYVQFLRDLPGARVVGVADVVASRAEAMGEVLGAPARDGLPSLLARDRPSLVVVATPSGMHAEHARVALEAGSHVLVEKPAAMTPAEIEANAALADERGLMYAVAFQNRLNPAVRLLADAAQRGRFGAIVSVAVRLRWCREQAYYEDGWHGTWASDGGVINQQAIHHVDVLQWLFGPVESVAATIANRLNRLEAEDTLVAAVRLSGGGLGTIEATTAARPRDFEASLTVTGELGTARIGGVALNRVEEWDFVRPEAGDADAAVRCSQDVPSGYGLSHGPMLRAIVDELARGGVRPPVGAREGGATTRLVHALYASAESGGWTALSASPVSTKLGASFR